MDDTPPNDDLDPALIARLEAWFGSPTTSTIPRPAPPPPPPPQHGRDDHGRARRRALQAVKDSPLAARLEARGRTNAAFVVPLPRLDLEVERPPSKFDLARWRLLQIEPGELMRPDDLPDALQEQTPQALLRDLHRPVMYFDDVEFVEIQVIPPETLDPGRIRKLIGTDYRWRPDEPQLELARGDIAALKRRLRDEPWGEAPAEIARIAASDAAPSASEEIEREPTTEELIALFEPPR